jgi:glycosyltransferase involved in cell wall biosynthesis
MLSIMIMSHDNHELLNTCLKNIEAYTPIDKEIIIVDDASQPAYDFPYTVVRMPKRSNCCNLRNVGMEMATTDYVIWLDNDTMVGEGWYQPLIKELDNDKQLGMVGYHPCGRLIRKPFLPLSQDECMHEAQFLEQTMPDGSCDFIVSYILAMRKDAFRPTYCYGMPTPTLDPEMGAMVKAQGYSVRAIQGGNHTHLGSATQRPGGNGYQLTLARNFYRWWKFWEPHQNIFELYK